MLQFLPTSNHFNYAKNRWVTNPWGIMFEKVVELINDGDQSGISIHYLCTGCGFQFGDIRWHDTAKCKMMQGRQR